MPARKRKAPTKASAPTNKKVRIDDALIVEEPEDTLPTRPKRKSVGTVNYKEARTNKSKKQADNRAEAEEPAVPDVGPKRRGRPPKKSAIPPPPTESDDAHAQVTPAKKRGRPATKNLSKELPAKAVTSASTTGKRGRPRKVDTDTTGAVKKQPLKVPTSTTTKKASGPGRPVKAIAKAPKSVTAKAAKSPKSATAKGTGPLKKRGRPSKASLLPSKTSLANGHSDYMSDTDGMNDQHSDEEQGDRQYWLLKAEPNDRFENGINVKFSIDDLAAAEVPEPWDGVRNFAARNNMRAMRKNDLAFFYHSSCAVPGIVGVMRIVQEHSPDQSAFDPNHPYYDPKSHPADPKWDCVHVEFVKKFDTMVTLKMLQENKNRGAELRAMQLLRLGRLSVSAVTEGEWKCVLGMANEDDKVGEEHGVIASKGDGYEGDTDGEVNGGPREELNGDLAAAVEMEAEVDMKDSETDEGLATSDVKDSTSNAKDTTSDVKDTAGELIADYKMHS